MHALLDASEDAKSPGRRAGAAASASRLFEMRELRVHLTS